MRTVTIFTAVILACLALCGSRAAAQSPYLTISTGLINYQGDLQPNSFTLAQSKPFGAVGIWLPISGYLAWRASFMHGAVQASDAKNRDYLKARNLSFQSDITEFFTGAEISILNTQTHRISPYITIGMSGFHFNPFTYTAGGEKVYLQPLSTEGQGLSQYPERKVYSLNQLALAYSGGIRFAVSEQLRFCVEFAQRKTFTDYLDDVSSSYVDEATLRGARGDLAASLAYRGDELPNGYLYPHAGDQRGTPTEKDWYYSMGVTMEVGLQGLGAGWFKHRRSYSDTRCPTRF